MSDLLSKAKKNAEKFADDNDLEGKLETGKSKAKEALSKARNATQALGESVSRAKEKNPDEYELAVIDYNLAYSEMNASGNNLLLSREKSVELIGYVTRLVNSIANTPKSFEQDFEEIRIAKAEFSDASEYAEKELQAARNSAASAASGVTAGIAVASLAPSAAMWVATTFGTASTGAAISTLSGAAATNAALAWLGGGALAAGGTGMAGGSAFLALAGPVGWTVAGATLLTSIVLFAKKKHDLNEKKHGDLLALQKNAHELRELTAKIEDLRASTEALRNKLEDSFMTNCSSYSADYVNLAEDAQLGLGALVNKTKSLSHLLGRHVETSKNVTTEGSAQ